MDNNWKLVDKQFTISPEAMNALHNSHANNLREALKPSVNYEVIKNNKIDELKSELKTQNYLAAEQLDELANANRQLKEEKLMLEGRLDAFKEQNEELITQNKQLQEEVNKAGRPNYKMDFIISLLVIIVGEIIFHWKETLEFVLSLLNQ